MEYLNLHTSALDSEAVLDAEKHDIGTWLFLQRFCIGQENGGLIPNARNWPEAKWQRLARVSRADVDRPSALWSWTEDDLAVKFYPLQQQLTLQNQRSGGSAGGRRSGAVRRPKKQPLQPPAEAPLEGSLQPPAEAPLERNGREGKGKKGKVREEGAHSPGVCTPPTADEVRAWARANRIPEAYALEKCAATTERNGWVQNGQLLRWQERFTRFWKEDAACWTEEQKKKSPPPQPAGWRSGDQAWWWTDSLADLDAALTGALLGGRKKTAARLRQILQARKPPPQNKPT